MRLRTGNHHRRRVERRAVYEAGFTFHKKRTQRLMISSRTDRLRHSGFVQRMTAQQKRALS